MGTATSVPVSNIINTYDGTPESFIHIMNEVQNKENEMIRTWKIACLYSHALKDGNDLGYVLPDIITEFMTLESNIKKLPLGDHKAQLMNCLYVATGDKKYLKTM